MRSTGISLRPGRPESGGWKSLAAIAEKDDRGQHLGGRFGMRRIRLLAPAAALALSSSAAFADAHQVVAVSGRDHLALYDLDSGAELNRFAAPGGSGDLVALPSGAVLANQTGANQVLLIDLNRRAEIARLPSSSLGGTRPVHLYLSPELGGKQYAVVLNDGSERRTRSGERPTDSTLLLIDATPSSPTYLKPVGETRLGIGHHKVGFSMKRPRFAVSNISDCADVISVYDYSAVPEIKRVKTFAATDLGYDGSTPLRSCDETGKAGVMLAPHGTGTSAATGHVYHYLTGTGQVAIFDVDAEVPSVKLVQTSGAGGASVKDLPGGRYMVVPQRGPRELHMKADGAPCQIGQLAVIDALARKLAAQVPAFYGEPTCKTSLAGTAQERASLQYAIPSPDGNTVFVAIGTLYAPANVVAASRFIAVFDLSDPYRPVQLDSIVVGAGDATRDLTLTGDGKLLLAANSLDNSVTVIDVAARKALRTFATIAKPHRLVTFGAGIGPSKPVGPATATAK
jgi:YVTN family beta-propeller protein